MNNFLVSIIIPCYNQAHYLDETLQSVLNQTYSKWECIIINDGSPDNSEEIALKWCQIDSRFNYYKKENGGLSSARNLGLDYAKGDFIQFLDSDDCLDKSKLEKSLESLNFSDNRQSIVITNFKTFVETINSSSDSYCKLDEKLFNFESVLYQWDYSFTIPIHCGLFESSLFDVFRFPENLKAKEDWVMWVSLFQKTNKVFFVDHFLAFYRINPNSMTKSENLFPSFLEALKHFSKVLTPEESNKLLITWISRFHDSTLDYKHKLAICKDSNTFKTGLILKKIALKTKVLPFFKFVLRKNI